MLGSTWGCLKFSRLFCCARGQCEAWRCLRGLGAVRLLVRAWICWFWSSCAYGAYASAELALPTNIAS
eukprot:10478575-Lingulodinium_polyedra.AAC.1